MFFRSWRLVVIACLTAVVGAFVVVPAGTAEAVIRPVVAVVGDSYTAAYGAGVAKPTTTRDAWWRTTAADLGWTPGSVVANPGAGFVDRGTYGTFAEGLKARPLSRNTNYVLLQGGYNDRGQSPAAVRAGLHDLLALIAVQAPNAVVVVVGAFLPSAAKFTANYLAVAQAIGDTRAIGRTRYLSGFLCAFSLSGDGVHPDLAGHQTIGHYVAQRIKRGLDNGDDLHRDSSGTFFTV
jgi:lysophospholipase L1-like esterase